MADLIDNGDGTWAVIVGTTRYRFDQENDARNFVLIVEPRESAAGEWARRVMALKAQFEQNLIEAIDLHDVFLWNELTGVIGATPEGAQVPGMLGLTKEDATALASVFGNLVDDFLPAPVEITDPATGETAQGPIRRAVLRKRYT
jgi:hypothetical protein